MFELYLIVIGLTFFGWLFALVRQSRPAGAAPVRPVVPVNVSESHEAVLVAAGHGRIVYVNATARAWFGMDGSAPNLTVMARRAEPADALYDLLASAGRISLKLGRRRVEGTSHPIPGPDGSGWVVVLRALDDAPLPAQADYDPRLALALADELGQIVSRALTLDATVEASLQAVGGVVAFTRAEITLWHPATQTLHLAGQGLTRTAAGALAPIAGPISDVVYAVGEGYTGWIAQYRQPLLIPDVAARADVRPKAGHAAFASYLGVPLAADGQFVGTLELIHAETDAFGPQDAALLQASAGHVAAALQTARRHEEQTTRVAELSGLQQIAEAARYLSEPARLYAQLTQHIAVRLGVELCGVLLYDEAQHSLRSQTPFYGLPDALIAGYQVPIIPGGELHAIWNEQPVWYTDDPTHPVLAALHLAQAIPAIRLRQVGLVPMSVSGQRVGALLVANRRDSRPFEDADGHLLTSFAAHAAIVVSNARLLQQSHERAVAQDEQTQRLTLLNRVALALAQTLDLENIFEIALREAALALGIGEGAALAIDAVNQLAHVVVEYPRGDDPPQRVFDLKRAPVIERARADLLPLTVDNSTHDPLAGELRVMVRRADVASSLFVPLVVSGEVIGILRLDAVGGMRHFTEIEIELAQTIASQAALAVQNAGLFARTLELATDLDRRVRERTAELEQERQHISTLYAIAAQLATSLDMERLLDDALAMVAQAVGATQGAIVAVDPGARLRFRARLSGTAPSSNDGEETVAVALDEGLAEWAIQQRQSVIVDDVQQDSRWTRAGTAPDAPRAAVAALIEAGEDVLGVALLYSQQAAAFTPDHLRLITAAARQIGAAMRNAKLYGLIRDQAERLAALLRAEQVEATQRTAILEAVADGVMVADAEGVVIVFNEAASRILERPVESVLHQPSSSITGLYGAGQVAWAETVRGWREDSAAYQAGEYLEERVTLENGRVVSARLAPVYLDEQFLGTVSIFRDISREVEVDRLKSEFVATVSHELRTPMTSIQGYAELLLMGAAGELSTQQRDFLATIKANADRLSILVNDLLDISRIDQGRIALAPAAVDAGALLEAVAAHVRRRSDEQQRAMTVVVDLSDDPVPQVWADAEKLTQILTNLADNAFSYTPAGGSITLSAAAADGGVILRIVDTGIGIPPAIGDRVFERFFRGDEAQELILDTPGAGLGLAIVRELVEAQRGAVWFESDVGAGTTFYVRLPAAPHDES